MNIKVIAFILLVGRVISTVFIISVIKRQIKLLRLPVKPELRHMRWVLLGLAVVILTSNLIPIGIDILTLFVETSRPARVSMLSLSYALSSNLPAVLESILIWLTYRMAELILLQDKE